MIENINVKKLNDLAKLPTRGSSDAAGYDLYAATSHNIEIQPHTTVKIGTGIATKRGLRPANCVGVVDSDYRGEVIVALHNDTDEIQSIEPQERIAQMILLPFVEMGFNEVEKLSNTERGEGGFGSSGTK